MLAVNGVLLGLQLKLFNSFLVRFHQVVLFLQNRSEACVLLLHLFQAPLHLLVPFPLLLLNPLFKLLTTVSHFLLLLLFLPHHLDFLHYLI